MPGGNGTVPGFRGGGRGAGGTVDSGSATGVLLGGGGGVLAGVDVGLLELALGSLP